MFSLYTENNSNSLDLLWTSGCDLKRDTTGARFSRSLIVIWTETHAEKNQSFNDLTTTLNCHKRLQIYWQMVVYEHAKKVSYTNTHQSFHIYMRVDMQEHTGKCKKQGMKAPANTLRHIQMTWLEYAYMHTLEGRFLFCAQKHTNTLRHMQWSVVLVVVFLPCLSCSKLSVWFLRLRRG